MRNRDWIGVLAAAVLAAILIWTVLAVTGTSEPAKVERHREPGLVWMKGER